MTSVKILVVESEPWMGEQFGRTLTKNGFEVTVTSNAYSAMDSVDEVKPDVIVMGLLLSGAGGLSLLHELQSYTDTAEVPIIVCCLSDEVSLDELRPYGVKRVLDSGTMKPNDLAGAVRSVLA